MDTKNGRAMTLVYFPNVVTFVRRMPAGIRDQSSDSQASLPCCLVTTVRRRHIDPGADVAVFCTPDADVRTGMWEPMFWHEPAVLHSSLALLATGIRNPILWVMGEYESTEIPALERSGYLPPGIYRTPHPGRLSHTAFVIRQAASDAPKLPCQQGYGHFPGARIAVFDAVMEPLDEYGRWLRAARAHAATPFDDLMVSDTTTLSNAVGFVSPYGEENRQHAVIAKEGTDRSLLVRQLSNALELPLVVSTCGEEQFQRWEWDGTLPSDLANDLPATNA